MGTTPQAHREDHLRWAVGIPILGRLDGQIARGDELPVDQITQVRVLDPYFSTGEGV
jgi:hypothetical protein